MLLRIEKKPGVAFLRVAEKPEEVPIPKTKSEFTPENGWLEYFLLSFWGPKRRIFRGRSTTRSFREGNQKRKLPFISCLEVQDT